VRVVQIVTQLETAGAQTLASWLSRKLGSPQIETRFLYFKSPSDLWSLDDCLMRERPSSISTLLQLLIRLRRCIRTADVVIAHTHYAIMLVLLVWASLPRRPRLVLVHHWPEDRYPAPARLVLAALGGRAEHVYVAEGLGRRTNAMLIPNPVPEAADCGAASDVDLVLIARHSVEKGIDVALRAMQLLPDRSLVLAGSGPETAHLMSLAQDLGLQQRVTFLGSIPGPEVRALMRGADAVLLPSRWEAMPMVLLEGVAEGAKLIVSRIPAHERFLRHGAAIGCEVDNPFALAVAVRQLGDPEVVERLEAGRGKLQASQSEATVIESWRELMAL